MLPKCANAHACRTSATVCIIDSHRFIDNPSTSHYIAERVARHGVSVHVGISPFGNRLFLMNIAVFASGRGSNFEAILTAIERGTLPARVVVLVSNKSSAGAMELARARGIPAVHVSQQQFSSEEEYVNRLLAVLSKHKAEFIALAGYLKKIPRRVVERFRHKIVNIHPALLPKFGGAGMYGIHVHEAVLAAGETITGATVHVVDEEYDRGAIILQRTVNVEAGDTPETLAACVLTIEHELYPEALRAFAEGRVEVNGTKAWIKPAASHRQRT